MIRKIGIILNGAKKALFTLSSDGFLNDLKTKTKAKHSGSKIAVFKHI